MGGLNSMHVIVIYCNYLGFDDLFLDVMPYSFVGSYQHFKETGLHTPENGSNRLLHIIGTYLCGAIR
jgi:hypothetical protein